MLVAAADKSVANAVEKALNPLILTSPTAMLVVLKVDLATLSLVSVVTPVAPFNPKEVASDLVKGTFKPSVALIPIWNVTSALVPSNSLTSLKLVVLAILSTWVLTKTRYGNWIFASGGDKNGATNVGVPVGRVKIGLFITTAVASTIFATIQVLDAGSADTMRGSLKELEAIAAAVVGGCLLTGGYGSAIGAAFGAIIFGTVSMGIFYTDVDTDWFKVFLGAMMLIAVIFNNYIRKKVTESK